MAVNQAVEPDAASCSIWRGSSPKRYLAAGAGPDYRSISRFRARHLDDLAGIFAQSLHLAQRLGMVKMGRVTLDGTKVEANASKHKAMSYARLVDKEQHVEAEIAELEAAAAALPADAAAVDAAEDEKFGRGGKDTDLPGELDRREKRPAKMQAARAQIEAEAAERARRHSEDKERRRQGRSGAGDNPDAVQAAGDKAASARSPARRNRRPGRRPSLTARPEPPEQRPTEPTTAAPGPNKRPRPAISRSTTARRLGHYRPTLLGRAAAPGSGAAARECTLRQVKQLTHEPEHERNRVTVRRDSAGEPHPQHSPRRPSTPPRASSRISSVVSTRQRTPAPNVPSRSSTPRAS